MRVSFTTLIDETLLKRAKIRAIEEGRYVNDIIEELLREYLEEEEEKKNEVDRR